MKLFLFSIISLLVSSAVTAQSTVAPQVPDSLKFKSLKPIEFQTAWKQSENRQLYDVREFFEYKKSRISTAINLPSSGDLELAADTTDKNRCMFFYCSTGYRSKRVALYFYDQGFRNLYSLDGGIKAWKKDGLKVEKKIASSLPR
jgi:rhodanese-related sulfurtransferase